MLQPPPVINAASLLLHAADVIEAIENAINLRDPDIDPFETLDPFISLQECEFPSHIDDPLQIVRAVLGDARADWLEYEDDIATILADVEFCRDKLMLRGDSGPHETPEGDSEGEESDHSEDR